MQSPPKHALMDRANVRDLPMMSIAAYTAGTRQVGTRRTVAVVTPTACDRGDLINRRYQINPDHREAAAAGLWQTQQGAAANYLRR